MSYNVAISPSAKEALRDCFLVYGQGEEIRAWIKALADTASKQLHEGSIDVETILKDILSSPLPRVSNTLREALTAFSSLIGSGPEPQNH